MTPESQIHRAYDLGQSFWLDHIRRDLVTNGELAELIQAGEIRGVTSNPSIFQQAIGNSDLYQFAMRPLAHAGLSAEQIFEVLAVDDIRAATDLFLPLYEGTDGRDGFVSIEVNPKLAADTENTLEEARRLWEWVNRPNLMVKIPATPEGIPAIEQAIFEGININVTLIFSLDRYAEVMEAYLRGLERRAGEDKTLQRVASVASFFISRVDSAVDGSLEAIVREEGPGAERAQALLGKAAISNAKMAYAQFKLVFEGERFAPLRDSGARLQRPLWASTSTKNPAYSDVLYINELIGQHTVNTVPPKTLDAFREHGVAESRLEAGISDARAQLDAISALGIDLEEITADLEQEGVRAFAEAYASLLETVRERADRMRSELGSLSPRIERYFEHFKDERVAPRFWRTDPDLWPETRGGSIIKMRLEWLDTELDARVGEATKAAGILELENIKQIGSIGNGSFLEAMAEALDGGPTVVELASLDPTEQRSFARHTPVETTLFVVRSRALVDPATLAKLEGVWKRAQNRIGKDAQKHFIVIAPEGSQIDEWASERNIPCVDEWNGSSEAPVSAAGFVQAIVLGGDPTELAEGSRRMVSLSSPGSRTFSNPGLYLGATLAAAEIPMYLIADPGVKSRADWLVKYVRARVRLPIRTSGPQDHDGVNIYLRSDGELEGELRKLEAPLVVLQTDAGLSGLGAEAVRWEVGVGAAAHLLSEPTYAGAAQLPASERLQNMVERQQKKGDFGFSNPDWEAEYGSSWWSWSSPSNVVPTEVNDAASWVIERLRLDSSLFIGMYQSPSRATVGGLTDIQDRLAQSIGATVACEFGRLPEAKLSEGVSLLIAADAERDLEIPGRQTTYASLLQASVLADFEQLKDAGVNASCIYFHTREQSAEFIRALASQAEIHIQSLGARAIEGDR